MTRPAASVPVWPCSSTTRVDATFSAEPQQRDAEQHRRKHREIERPLHVDHGEHDHERQRDVEREEHVEQERRQRHDHHREQRDDEQRHAEPEAADVASRSREHRGASCLNLRVATGRGAARASSASIVELRHLRRGFALRRRAARFRAAAVRPVS